MTSPWAEDDDTEKANNSQCNVLHHRNVPFALHITVVAVRVTMPWAMDKDKHGEGHYSTRAREGEIEGVTGF